MSPRSAARLAWSLWGICVVLSLSAVAFLAISWSTPPPPGAFGFRGFAAMFALTFGTVGALVASKQPRNPIGWIALASALISGLQGLANEYAIWALLARETPLALGEMAAWIPAWIWIPSTAGASLILLLFPDGHFLSPRWRWVAWMLGVGVLIGSVGFALVPGPLENFGSVDNPVGLGSRSAGEAVWLLGLTVYGFAFILSAVAVASRFRRSRGDEREQMKWLVAAGVFLSLTLVSSFLSQIANADPGAQVAPWVSLLVIAGFSTLPIAMGFAILKYRLYDIDVVISKAVVYGTLAAVITLIYLGIVAGIGAVAGSGGNVFLSAVAAAVVAVAFQPVRRWAQRLADRLVYGKRATPYEVLSQLSSRFAETYSLEDALPRLARVTAEAVGAARTRVWLREGRSLRQAASWPQGDVADPVALAGDDQPELDADGTRFPVRHQGELLGAISVQMPPSEPLSSAQTKLLADVADQAGLVLRNVGLLEDLRISRRRLVAAQDEGRRRLERNIHDGAQQQLVALTVQLRLLEQQIEKDPVAAKATAARLQGDATTALEDLRDLARGIYPPLLADKGLEAALQAQARKSPVPVEVLGDDLGRFGQDVEAAVYFCVLEALQNVAKYAEATSVRVELTVQDGHLGFEVIDDGRGFDLDQDASGTGLQGMSDRLAAIGGELSISSTPGDGTRVSGRVPTKDGP